MKLLLLLTPEDKPYMARFSDLLDSHKASVYWGKIESAGQIDILMKRIGAKAAATTNIEIVKLIIEDKAASLSHFQGSIIDTPLNNELLIIPPLKWLIRVSYGEWLIQRYLSKILIPESWYPQSQFRYRPLLEEKDYQEFKAKFSEAILCAVDIETKEPNIIRSISYTLKFQDDHTETGCFLLDSVRKVQWMRELNWLPIPKVCQNGKYECAHFYAWSAPMYMYIGDTLSAMHSTWSELPKDLNAVASVLVRKYRYWKNMRQIEGNNETLLEYNALDTWGTCEAFCSWLRDAPEYAIKNYLHKWPQIIISHMMEMRGLKRDILRKTRWERVFKAKLAVNENSLAHMIRSVDFNPRSPKQVAVLLKGITGRHWESTDEKTLRKVSLLHPLNERILETLLGIRGEGKLVSTYLSDKDYQGRWLYTINPTGTETGRDASKAHHFWCGQNVQNVPAEYWQIKNSVIADNGFELWEADFSQAEARGVAYCSGDENLLEVVESPKDFHSLNASGFFGIPYDEIYQDEIPEWIDAETGECHPAVKAKKLNKHLRDLAKRVNHGANYNMGPAVLVDTMGPKKVREAQKLLNLPPEWSLLQVAQHLLTVYEITYPRIKTRYYKWIVQQVKSTHKLVGATGWTRYCFGHPWDNKLDLNAYVAHVTQSLNAMMLDRVTLRIFKWILAEKLMSQVRLCAKIHDSILFQTPIGKPELAKRVASLMELPVQITDCTGVTRSMLVPVDLKHCGKRWEMFQ